MLFPKLRVELVVSFCNDPGTWTHCRPMMRATHLQTKPYLKSCLRLTPLKR